MNPETRGGQAKERQTQKSQSQIQARNVGALVDQSLRNSNSHKGRDEWILWGLLQMAFRSFSQFSWVFRLAENLWLLREPLTACTGPSMLSKYLWGEWLNDFNFSSSPSRDQQMLRESKLITSHNTYINWLILLTGAETGVGTNVTIYKNQS